MQSNETWRDVPLYGSVSVMGWWLDYVASMWTITAVWQQNTTTNEAMNGQHAEMLWYVLLVLRMKTGNNGGALPSMRDCYVLRPESIE